MTTYTPVQLAQLLGFTDEARPGKVVRDYLREKYPDHDPRERWELDEAQAADVIANVPRQGELASEMHPWLDVPGDRVEPIGALAIASGRIEGAATVTLRALLRPLDRGTSDAIASTLSFRATTRLVRKTIESSAISQADSSLLNDWKDWEGRAESFMGERNALLHGMWARAVHDPSEYRLFSLSRNRHESAPSAGVLLREAARGMQIAKDGYFAGRIAVAIASHEYQAQIVGSGDTEDWLRL